VNTGKTSLLQHVIDERSKSNSGQSKPNISVSYINCRAINASSPSGMARALTQTTMRTFVDDLGDNFVNMGLFKTVLPLLSAFTDEQQTPIGKLKLSGKDLSDALANLQRADLTLTGVIEAYTRMLRQCEEQRKEGTPSPPVPSPPVIVIDEANVLMNWDASSKGDLETLIRFFVHMTKESRRCHVLLATSDSTFLVWLEQCEWLAAGSRGAILSHNACCVCCFSGCCRFVTYRLHPASSLASGYSWHMTP
jgi:Cdc6-like AAA superfamily ATPase